MPSQAPSAPSATTTFAEDSAGRSAASVGFGRALPDGEVEALLRQYDVRPFAVYLGLAGMPGIHDVSIDLANMGLIAEARRARADAARAGPCLLLARLRAGLRAGREARPAANERDRAGQMRLAELEMARSAAARFAAGEPAVYGVKVVGRSADLRRLAADPRVREFHAAQPVRNGARDELFSPGIGAPPELQRPSVPAEIEALSAVEVRDRLRRAVEAPPPECREDLRNADMSEPAVRAGAAPGRPGWYAAAGLVFRAEPRLAPRRAPGPQAADVQAPEAVQTSVTVTNPSGRAIESTIRGCTVLLRAYHAASGADSTAEPAWSEGGGGQCMQAPMALALQPGESRRFEHETDVWRILGEALPPGRYAIAARFRLADRTIEIPAGQLELSPGLEGLAYQAEARVVGAELHASASVTNASRRPIYIEYGAGALRLGAYRGAGRSGVPAWLSDGRAPWDGTARYGYPSYLATHTLAPGETFRPREFQAQIPLIEVLGDSLPDGRYHFGASLRLNFRRTEEIPAGSIDLALDRPPLPTVRTADLVTYRAGVDTVPTSPPGIRIMVTATLTHAGSSRLRYSADCSVVVYAYRDRGRRDAAPRSGPADWTSARDCGSERQELTLNRGEARTFEVRAAAREILGGSLEPGRYYFAVAVRAEQRTVYLAAGEAVLGGSASRGPAEGAAAGLAAQTRAAACAEPGGDSLRADFQPRSLAGAYELRLVELPSEGHAHRRATSGTLWLWPASARDSSSRLGLRPRAGDTVAHPLYGAVDVAFDSVHAPVSARRWPTGARRELIDPLEPDVLALVWDPPPRAGPYTRLGILVGTVVTRRPDIRTLDGGGIALWVQWANGSGFGGHWSEFGLVAGGTGFYCAHRRRA